MSFDADAMIRRIRTEAARRLLAAAITLQTDHRADVSVGNPAPHDHPAPQGDYPRLRTGQGRAGVAVSPASIAEVMAREEVSVGYRPPLHLYFLGARGWKGLVDTYTRERAKLAAIMGGGP